MVAAMMIGLTACSSGSDRGNRAPPTRPRGEQPSLLSPSGSPRPGDGDRGCPPTYEAGPPTQPDVTFKEFTPKGGGAPVPIKLDVYASTSPSAVPSIVLLHGGGWTGGCRSLLNEAAVELSRLGFTVFSADYRLSCTSTDQATPEEAPLCGWTWQDIDPDTGMPGAAVHDAADAVAWVRDHAADYHPSSGKVAIVGGSSGGTLALMAGGTTPKGDPRHADAVGGWSAVTQFGKTSDGVYTCDGAGGGQGATGGCWRAVIQYLGCDIRRGDPGCAGVYEEASPVEAYASDGPPAFIANSDQELVSLRDAEDLAARLENVGISHQLCIVQGNLHGRGYLDLKACGVDGPKPHSAPSVLQSTADFLSMHLA